MIIAVLSSTKKFYCEYIDMAGRLIKTSGSSSRRGSLGAWKKSSFFFSRWAPLQTRCLLCCLCGRDRVEFRNCYRVSDWWFAASQITIHDALLGCLIPPTSYIVAFSSKQSGVPRTLSSRFLNNSNSLAQMLSLHHRYYIQPFFFDIILTSFVRPIGENLALFFPD